MLNAILPPALFRLFGLDVINQILEFTWLNRSNFLSLPGSCETGDGAQMNLSLSLVRSHAGRTFGPPPSYPTPLVGGFITPISNHCLDDIRGVI